MKAFGDVVDAVRIKPTKPKAVQTRPAIDAERFLKACAAVKSGNYEAEKLRKQYKLTADQEQALAKCVIEFEKSK